MKLGIVIEGKFDGKEVAEAALKYNAQVYVYPAELHLDTVLGIPASKLYPIHLNAGFGNEAPYDRVFRLLNKVDALLVFARECDSGVVYAAIKKARNYSMPVEVIGCDGQIRDQPKQSETEGEVGEPEGASTGGRTAGTSPQFSRAQVAEAALA